MINAAVPNATEGGEPPSSLPGFEHVRRYWDKTRGKYVAKILPGEYYVTTHDELVTTVLGSCVAACIRDRILGIGGMNHFMLPARHHGGNRDRHGVDAATRYGVHAMEHLINDILKHGGRRENLEVKVFGGGQILAEMTDIGARNIAFVREFVATERLPLVSEDLGDVYPRKVVYEPRTGRAQRKKLRSLHNDTILRREMAYLRALGRRPVAGEVELF